MFTLLKTVFWKEVATTVGEWMASCPRGWDEGGGGACKDRVSTETDGAKREGGRKLATREESCQKPETSFHDANPRWGWGGAEDVQPCSRDYK